MVVVGPIGSHVAAQAHEHIVVDFDIADQKAVADEAIIVTLPSPGPDTHNSPLHVSDISHDGGLGSGMALRIVGVFAKMPGGNNFGKGYVVANDGAGRSRRGAFVELRDLGIQNGGWIVVAEGCQPMAPPNPPGV